MKLLPRDGTPWIHVFYTPNDDDDYYLKTGGQTRGGGILEVFVCTTAQGMMIKNTIGVVLVLSNIGYVVSFCSSQPS